MRRWAGFPCKVQYPMESPWPWNTETMDRNAAGGIIFVSLLGPAMAMEH